MNTKQPKLTYPATEHKPVKMMQNPSHLFRHQNRGIAQGRITPG
ncbi:hypothetical protein [Synechocystis sp. LKSZ1]